MQELIEQLKEQAQFIKDYDCAQDKFYRTGLRNAIKYAESMLEKEKEVIMEAHQDGAFHTEWDEATDIIENAQDYYNETFNTKEK